VETERELNLGEMSRYQTVGVTAGASTPHWLISNVVSTLKHAWLFRPGSWINYLYRAWRFILKSNLYVAPGRGFPELHLFFAAGGDAHVVLFFMAFFYVYAMHLLNQFTDEASKFNDPVQSMFYGRHRLFLLSTGALSALMALGSASIWTRWPLSLFCYERPGPHL